MGQIIGNTLPWSIFLVGVGFLCSFLVGTTLGMFAAWRRGGFVDNVLTPRHDGVAVVPGLLPEPRLRLLPRAQARAGSRSSTPTRRRESASTGTFIADAFRHAELPILVIIAHQRRRLAARHAQRDDQHRRRGLRRVRARQRAARLARDDALRGAGTRSCRRSPGSRPSSRSAVGGLILIEVVFSYPGVGLTIQTGRARRTTTRSRRRCLLLLVGLRARRQPDHGLRLRPPRPPRADAPDGWPSTLERPADGSRAARGAVVAPAPAPTAPEIRGVPQSVRLLLANRKSAFGRRVALG